MSKWRIGRCKKNYVFSLGPLKGSTLISHLARQNHLVSKMVTSLIESRKRFLNGGQDWKQTSHAQKSLSPYNIKIYIRHVQRCHLNERVQQLQHNAAAQLTPPPPHTAYEQLATMVSKIPRNNLITHSAQNISPPPHSSQIPPYLDTPLRALLPHTAFKPRQISYKHKLLRLYGRWKGCMF